MDNISRRTALIGAGATALAAAIPGIPDSSKAIFAGIDLAGSAERSCFVILNHSGMDVVVRELKDAHGKIIEIMTVPARLQAPQRLVRR